MKQLVLWNSWRFIVDSVKSKRLCKIKFTLLSKKDMKFKAAVKLAGLLLVPRENFLG